MSFSNETNEQCCLSPLDSAKFIMERSKHVSIDIHALQKLSKIVFYFYSIFNIKNSMKFCLDILCNDGWTVFN